MVGVVTLARRAASEDIVGSVALVESSGGERAVRSEIGGQAGAAGSAGLGGRDGVRSNITDGLVAGGGREAIDARSGISRGRPVRVVSKGVGATMVEREWRSQAAEKAFGFNSGREEVGGGEWGGVAVIRSEAVIVILTTVVELAVVKVAFHHR